MYGAYKNYKGPEQDGVPLQTNLQKVKGLNSVLRAGGIRVISVFSSSGKKGRKAC